MLYRYIKILILFNLPLINCPQLTVEVNRNLDNLASVALVWNRVTLLVDLEQGFLHFAVVLEFKDIDMGRGLDDHVCSASGVLDLRLNEGAEKTRDDEEDEVVALLSALKIFVWNLRDKGTHHA